MAGKSHHDPSHGAHNHAGHAHSHGAPKDIGEGRLAIAVGVNVLLTVAQIVGGVVSGSLSLVADALHNLNDAASLGVALVARRIAKRPADRRRTFGYRRAETIGALINLTALVLIGFYLIYEAVSRYFNPQEIDGWIVVWVAALALVIDAVTAWLTYAPSKDSLNIKAAFVHNVADALGSVAVIIAGTLILLYDWMIADLIATLLIAAYVLWHGSAMMKETIRILMESVPGDVAIEDVVAEVESIGRVKEMHHIHVWQLDEHHRALEAHVVIDCADLEQIEEIKDEVKDLLAARFDIHHSTLEIEILEECLHRDHEQYIRREIAGG